MVELRRIGDRIEVAVQEVEDFLDSPAGRRLRRLLAGAAIVGAVGWYVGGARGWMLLRRPRRRDRGGVVHGELGGEAVADAEVRVDVGPVR